MGGSSARKSIRHGEKRAIKELANIYEGPLEGLRIGMEFYKMLQSPELAGTPLAKGLALQGSLLDEVNLGLTGGTNFNLPTGLGQAISNQAGAALGAAGIEGSPAGALAALDKLVGFSEDVRQNRLGQALTVLGSVAGGSILPSAQDFLKLGAEKALTSANYRFQGGLARSGVASQEQAAMGSLLGMGLSAGLGALTGGIGLLGGVPSLGSALLGGGVASGLLPSGFLGRPMGGSPLGGLQSIFRALGIPSSYQ